MSILFTDVDDVLVLQRTLDFNRREVIWNEDLCRRLLHPPAMFALTALVQDGAKVVITSNWTRFLDRAGFQRLFELGGYPIVGEALHVAWHAPRMVSGTRLDAIDAWLAQHHAGESFAILDDINSGSGLRGSRHDADGRLVLCDVGVGLHSGHVPALRVALETRPPLPTATRVNRPPSR